MLSSHSQSYNASICAWPSLFKTAQACEFDTFDLVRAGTLYNSAAEGGHAGAQLRLAEAYEKGELGQEIDLQLALMWYRKAAEGGDKDAQSRLGDAHWRGQLGLEIDLGAALTWFEKAAKGGQRYAQWRLGCCPRGRRLGCED